MSGRCAVFLTLRPGCCQCGTDPELITDLAELGLILFASEVTVIVAGQCRFRLRQYEGRFSSSCHGCGALLPMDRRSPPMPERHSNAQVAARTATRFVGVM